MQYNRNKKVGKGKKEKSLVAYWGWRCRVQGNFCRRKHTKKKKKNLKVGKRGGVGEAEPENS